jgi:hypothetical protein
MLFHQLPSQIAKPAKSVLARRARGICDGVRGNVEIAYDFPVRQNPWGQILVLTVRVAAPAAELGDDSTRTPAAISMKFSTILGQNGVAILIEPTGISNGNAAAAALLRFRV